MPQPQAYERQTDFTERDGDDTDHAALNQELDAAALSIDGIRDNLALIQKDDGGLKNGVVTPESLAPETFTALQGDVAEAVADAQAAATSALTSATTANAAKDAAALSATAAQTSQTAAALNATTASTAATAATGAQAAVAASAAAALASEIAAELAETNAGTHAGTATAQAVIATAQAVIATAKAADALASEGTATAQAATSTAQAVIATTQAGTATAQAVAAADSAAAAAASAATVSVKPSARQCVLEGPVDASGYAAFGGAVGGATLTAAGTLKATAAAGGELNYTGSIVNPVWNSPAGSGTGFLMLAITAGDVVTTAVRTLAPAWQFGGAYSTTTDQLTFNEQEATMKAGGGDVATQVYEVCVGECPYTDGVWSGTIIWYQLRAEYDTAMFAVVANTLYSKNANVGGPCDLFLFFSTGETGLLGGTNEEVPYGGPGDGPNSNYRGCLFGQSTRNVVRARTQDIFQVMDAAGASSNPASGYLRIRAKRRFR